MCFTSIYSPTSLTGIISFFSGFLLLLDFCIYSKINDYIFFNLMEHKISFLVRLRHQKI